MMNEVIVCFVSIIGFLVESAIVSIWLHYIYKSIFKDEEE